MKIEVITRTSRIFLYLNLVVYYGASLASMWSTVPDCCRESLDNLNKKLPATVSSNFNPISFSPQKTNLSNWPWYSLTVSTPLCSNEESAGLANRPPEIQAAVDKAFKRIMRTGQQEWLYNGDFSGYGLLNLDDDQMLRNLAFENPEKKDIYIIDVGCSTGGWGKYALEILFKDEACEKSGKHYHIFSITGGKECAETVLHRDHVTLYQFNQFKIENIDEELSKRGFNLKNNVDLIVSQWTLRHLVDPFGTLKRMYGLLTPAQGKLLSNGFWFMFNDSDRLVAFPQYYPNILSHTNTILFNHNDNGRDIDHFLLVRNDEKDLRIPLIYTNKTQYVKGDSDQIASHRVSIYEKGSCFNSSINVEDIDEKGVINLGLRHLYCDKNNQYQQCKSLYFYLIHKKLFRHNYQESNNELYHSFKDMKKLYKLIRNYW